jgi:hypothetical protein
MTPAMTRFLAEPPPAVPPCVSPEAVVAAADQLAALLEPLPGALHELTIRISRHCAVTHRDTELARLTDLVSGRTWSLFLAVRALHRATGQGAGG